MAYPLAFGHWQVHRDRLLCRLPRKTVSVTAPALLLRQVLALCDGRLGWKAVTAQLCARWSRRSVQGFLEHLAGEGVLVEAGESLAHWSALGQLPALYPCVADETEVPLLHRHAEGRLLEGTGLGTSHAPAAGADMIRLLRQRQSHRTYADRPVPAEALCSILWAAHGVARPAANGGRRWHRTVASGGNLHSARWFVAVLRELPGDAPMGPGLYEARFHRGGGASLQPLAAGPDRAWRLLGDPRVLRFASALVLPVHDVSVPARKYGNRATVFAQVEAGQCLQNAQLMATAWGLGCTVRGDTSAAEVLDWLRPHLQAEAGAAACWLPMPSLVLGARPEPRHVALQQRETWIELGCAPGGAAARTAASPEDRHAFVAGPIRTEGSEFHACGRAANPRDALHKAEAEAWERRGWATVGAAERAPMGDMAGAVDPSCVVAYAPCQWRDPAFPLRPFSASREYLWRRGVEVESGATVRLPAECLHALSALPPELRAQACANTSTSGVAAWTTPEGALERATLELIERDAFLRSWLRRHPPALVRLDTLPGGARARLRALERAGHRVAVADLRDAPVPVFSVFVQCAQRPFTAITAAAGFDAQEALHKAIDEAQGRAEHAAAFPAPPVARVSDVQSHAGVNRYFQTRRFFRRSDFYADGPHRQRFGEPVPAHCSDWPALRSRMAAGGMRLLAFDLTPSSASLDQGRVPLHVMRAVIPGLLPIWFHHALAPAGLPAFRAAAGRATRATSLIHPFT